MNIDRIASERQNGVMPDAMTDSLDELSPVSPPRRSRAPTSPCSWSTMKPVTWLRWRRSFSARACACSLRRREVGARARPPSSRASGAHRLDDAGHERCRATARAQGSIARYRGRADDGLRHRETAVQAMRDGAYDFVGKAAQAHDHRQERAQGRRASVTRGRESLVASRAQAVDQPRNRRSEPALRRVLDVATQAARPAPPC